MKHLEIVTIKHKSIRIIVQIDYDNELISIVEPYYTSIIVNDEDPPVAYKPKTFTFEPSPLERVHGWCNQAEAIKFALKKAGKILDKEMCRRMTPEFKKSEAIINDVIY